VLPPHAVSLRGIPLNSSLEGNTHEQPTEAEPEDKEEAEREEDDEAKTLKHFQIKILEVFPSSLRSGVPGGTRLRASWAPSAAAAPPARWMGAAR